MLHDEMVLNHTAQANARKDVLHQDCQLPAHNGLWCSQRVGLALLVPLPVGRLRSVGGPYDGILQKLHTWQIIHFSLREQNKLDACQRADDLIAAAAVGLGCASH